MEGAQQKLSAQLCLLAPADSPRLRYVVQWLEEVWGIKIVVVLAEEHAAVPKALPVLAYGVRHAQALAYIPDEGLLWETGINMQCPVLQQFVAAGGEYADTETEEAQNLELPLISNPAAGVPGAMPSADFDVLSAVFFLLSRYEEYFPELLRGQVPRQEYFPWAPDRHGRYRAGVSVQYKAMALRRPVVDEWLHALKALLAQAVAFPLSRFSFQPTYDIDAAWAYRHKGFLRNAGALIKDVAALNWSSAAGRAVAVFRGKDPHDAYGWLQCLHRQPAATPRYFVLAALSRTQFDKNIHPAHPDMKALIQQLSEVAPVWMHPSYFSTEPSVFKQEQKALEAATGKAISQSRQHYIRFALPDGYRYLIARGITHDWSMGYGTHLGFRAGTGRSFLWYDLEREKTTTLRVHPFCFMDTTAHYYEQMSAAQAFDALRQMAEILRKTESTLVTIFHNFSLGTDPAWAGWRAAYAALLAAEAQP